VDAPPARLPALARLLSALLRGRDADVVRGDLEEAHQRRVAMYGVGSRARLDAVADAAASLLHWWSPDAVRRRRPRTPPVPTEGYMTTIGSDLRQMLRSLARRPGYAATVAITLGLGIGATTTMYSVIDAMLLRPLPYRASDRLVLVGNTAPGREWLEGHEGLQRLGPVSLDAFRELRTRTHALDQAAAIDRAGMLVQTPENGAEAIDVAIVQQGFFDLLSASPLLGRLPTEGDAADPAGLAGAAISYAGWQRRFGGDPDVVGKHYGGFTIIGVLPSDFVQPAALVGTDVEFWVHLDAADPRYAGTRRRGLQVLARLAPGVSVDGARRELSAAQRQLAVERPGEFAGRGDLSLGIGVNSLRDATIGSGARPVLIFLGAAVLLLLLAGTNAANLLIVRGLERDGERSLRRALGAGRGRLAASVVGESVALALAGGVVGLAIAAGGVAAFRHFGPQTVPRMKEVAVNGRIIAAGALLSLLVGVTVGLLPAVRSSGADLLSNLRSSLTAFSPRGTRLRTALAATQLALALVLGVGASLLLRSFVQLRSQPLGFSPNRTVTFSVLFKSEHMSEMWDQVLDVVRRVPGVTAVAGGSNLPFETPTLAMRLAPMDQSTGDAVERVAAYGVTPGYFAALHVPVLRGRAFDATDRTDSRRVVMVNESFARSAYGDRDPLGQRLRVPDSESDDAPEIVGVVADVVQARVEDGMRPAVYVPYTQSMALLHVVATTGRDAEGTARDARRALSGAGIVAPVVDETTLAARVTASRAVPRFQLLLIGAFAAVAVLLAAIGLYGTLAFTVRSRLREIGIRMAMGATQRQIFELVLRQGIAVLGLGMTAGVLGALALTRLMEAFLYRVRPADPLSFLFGLVILSLSVLVAALRPARRAARVDPVTSLRADG
jgi:putative ABC transport system permease protein